MARQCRVSWRNLNERRTFGHFVRWMPDGNAKVIHGGRVLYLDPGEITWEVS